MEGPLVLALFVTSENRDRGLANLAAALRPLPAETYKVFEFDVEEYPELAEIARVLAVPTLIRYWPPPKVSILGDLSDADAVLDEIRSGIDIVPHGMGDEVFQDVDAEAVIETLRHLPATIRRNSA